MPVLKLDNKVLERVNEFLYLGTYVDEDLTWEPHINYISNKISKNIGILKRLKYTVPKDILKTLYFSLINPYINYSILAWGFNMDRIEKLQKQAIRVITDSYYLQHTNNLFQQLKILKIEDIFELKQILFYHKFLNNTLPISISEILTSQPENLRACHTAFFLKPAIRANTEAAKQCIRHSIPELINKYNNLDLDDKYSKAFIENISVKSPACVKKLFKEKTFLTYTSECTDEKCYPCISRFFSPFGFTSGMRHLHIFYYLRSFTFHKLFLCTGILSFLNIFNYTNNPH